MGLSQKCFWRPGNVFEVLRSDSATPEYVQCVLLVQKNQAPPDQDIDLFGIPFRPVQHALQPWHTRMRMHHHCTPWHTDGKGLEFLYRETPEAMIRVNLTRVRRAINLQPYHGSVLRGMGSPDQFIRNLTGAWAPRRARCEPEEGAVAKIYCPCPRPGCSGKGGKPMKPALGRQQVECDTCQNKMDF